MRRLRPSISLQVRERVAQAFVASGVAVEISDNVRGALWSKLLINCAYNALSALSGPAGTQKGPAWQDGVVSTDGKRLFVNTGNATHKVAVLRTQPPGLEVLLDAGPDLLAVETVPDVDEARAIVAALGQVAGSSVSGAGGTRRSAWMSFSCADDRTTHAGQPIEDAAHVVAEAGFAAVGVNCTAPDHVLGLVRRLRAAEPDLAVVVYPNTGRIWDAAAGVWLGEGSDQIGRAHV